MGNYDNSEEAEKILFDLSFYMFKKEFREMEVPSKQFISNWLNFCTNISSLGQYQKQIEEMNTKLFFYPENQEKEDFPLQGTDLDSISLTRQTRSRVSNRTSSYAISMKADARL